MPGADAAYAACLQLARTHYENFPVASRLLPRAARPHIAAIYAFARIADDFADEGTRPPGERLALLDGWQRRLDAAAGGQVEAGGEALHDAVFVALRETIGVLGREAAVPPLADLLSAFRQDVVTTRYATWSDLLEYCRRSANPVGRLVLLVSGHRDPASAPLSDAVCTALQLTNFWQDLAIDWSRGRLYVPLDLVAPSRAQTDDLDRRVWTSEWRAALREAGARTRALFDAGRPVADHVRGRLRYELRATWLGGVRILDRLAEADYDVFTRRPALSRRDAPGLFWRALTWTPGATARARIQP